MHNGREWRWYRRWRWMLGAHGSGGGNAVGGQFRGSSWKLVSGVRGLFRASSGAEGGVEGSLLGIPVLHCGRRGGVSMHMLTCEQGV